MVPQTITKNRLFASHTFTLSFSRQRAIQMAQNQFRNGELTLLIKCSSGTIQSHRISLNIHLFKWHDFCAFPYASHTQHSTVQREAWEIFNFSSQQKEGWKAPQSSGYNKLCSVFFPSPHSHTFQVSTFKCHWTHGRNAVIFLLPLISITSIKMPKRTRTNWTEDDEQYQPKVNRKTFLASFSCHTPLWRLKQSGMPEEIKTLVVVSFGSNHIRSAHVRWVPAINFEWFSRSMHWKKV